ncbi:NAD-dependent succinate-semialdehyde dehydrogenase [Nocardioides carbamazepini]|uniref:NAD-dependent succinate-semialdehyde dehydrogenase n=1 Tax=Nocardioides carbamazepini TaxID=2854259 RepID=UPI002149EE8C|nr:NAD-dependent succinate-semialdehyde dehydrogenase [Nocardioides carbamazepini]MCR1785262.1 NAD-dependent succinate-semialdehyde dehydrogenase [Nocardioides carbamazepini]
MTTAETVAPGGLTAAAGIPTELHIDGRWVDPGPSFEVVDPATGQPIARMSDAGAAETRAALAAAVGAQQEWGRWAPRVRADLFHRAHALLRERREQFARVMTAESGKPLSESRAEFDLSAGFFLWYAEQIAHLHGSWAHGSHGGYRVVTTHQPVGPCLLITPWNFPLLMSARKAGAALAAGCTVVMKTAQETPLTGALFTQTLVDAGFPAGVVNLLHTSRSATVSETALTDRRLRKISFTGSTGVGSLLLQKAAPNVVNASMELGGDGPFVVLDDADVDLAVEHAVICKFRNAGQACVAANRIILDDAVADEFTEKFVARARDLRVGNGFDEDTEVGPIISSRQRDRVVDLVERFRGIGAHVLTGGRPADGDGYFYEPTVMTLDSRDHELCTEELFAPLAALYRVRGVQEALDFANDTSYGLAAYVFTRDLDRAVTVAERLEFGMVGINRGIMADPVAPFGGVKASGLGREGGPDGIYEFLEPKYLAITVDEAKDGLR